MIATIATNKNSLKFKIIITKKKTTDDHWPWGVVVGKEVHIHLVFIV
jgi:hypothetical protein